MWTIEKAEGGAGRASTCFWVAQLQRMRLWPRYTPFMSRIACAALSCVLQTANHIAVKDNQSYEAGTDFIYHPAKLLVAQRQTICGSLPIVPLLAG